MFIRPVRTVECGKNIPAVGSNLLKHVMVRIPEILPGDDGSIEPRLIADEDYLDASILEPSQGFKSVGIESIVFPAGDEIRTVLVEDPIPVQE